MILNRDDIAKLLNNPNTDEALIITPLLDEDGQLNPCSIDLRLGCEFLVSVQTREPVIDWASDTRPVTTFFQETYRDIGDKFILYPGQLVLANTLEYIKIPNDIFCNVVTRSSWHRVGISVVGIVQPGYRGTISIELFNHSQNAIALYPGMRIIQLILFKTPHPLESGYADKATAKYVANITNQVAALSVDREINIIMGFK